MSMRRNQLQITILNNRLCANANANLNSQSLMRHHSSFHFSTHTTQNMNTHLSNEQKTFLEENGYLWIKNFVPQNVARNVQNRINFLLDNFDPNSTKSVFKTHRTEESHKDLYFLESGDKIRYFWEEHAFDSDGNLKYDPKKAINKIGHALHTLDPVIHSYVYGYLPLVAFDIGLTEPMPLQSMYICKQPGIGGEVGVHQDSTFLLTEPIKSCHALWLCVDDTSTSNGCIYLVPGSHKTTGLKNRFRRMQTDYEQTELIPLIGDGSLSKENGIAVEAKCCDLVIIHGETVHWSDANLSDDSRHALMIHVVDGKYEWVSDNWLQYEKGQETFPKFTKDDVANQMNVRQRIMDGFE